MNAQQRSADWKNFDDFAAGIATNRLPTTDALTGRSFKLTLDGGRKLDLAFADAHSVAWTDGESAGAESCDVILVAPDTYFIDMAFASKPTEAETIILDTRNRRALSVRARIRDADEEPGEPRVAQDFRAGVIGDELSAATGVAPGPTRDLIGLRAHYTYSPNHVYEHTYLSSTRYCWQNLVGVQRGHGDVDLATTWKFGDDLYIFAFREFMIPVASTFFYNFRDMRSTGKFLGVTGDGRIENSPAGAFIRKVSMTYYLPGEEPV